MARAKTQRLRRIAYVSYGKFGTSRRIALGVSKAALPKQGLIGREFFFADDDQELPAGPRRLPMGLLDWNPSAVISLVRPEVFDELEPLIQRGIPIVSMNRLNRSDIPLILSDTVKNFELVFQHFHGRAKSLGFVVIDVPHIYVRLLDIYRDVATRHGQPAKFFALPELSGLEQIRKLKKIDPAFLTWIHSLPKPAGLFAFSVEMGFYLWRCCMLAKLRVPEDVMLLGIDDFDVATASDPPITSLQFAYEDMGRCAVELASDMLAGKPAPPLTYFGGSKIIGRASTNARLAKVWDLDAALKFIEEHACEGINVEDLRTHTQHLARGTFHKKFMETMGITPRKALEDRRMREARRLLAETEMSPGWIANMCGYPDYLHFYKLFRKNHDVNPTDFRKAAGGQ